MTETVASDIDVDAGTDQVLGVLCDFESYPQWARSVKEARILERDDDGRAATVEFRVSPGPLPEVRYVLRYSYSPHGISWDYVEGDLKEVRGSYALEESDGRTHVTYNLAIDPGRLPLPGFVKARAAREITRVALKELKRRVEAR
ncbi:MAG TPA: SRPBCC family protein [Actinomycetota bacterium]|nr:SRPBCC family protein [Actinomycetota bacterium]